MAEIKAFRGFRYNPAVAGDIGKLIAPPYDVIDDNLCAALLRLSPYNICNITRAERASRPGAQPYESAAALWKEWREQGVFTQEDKSSLYMYEQFFNVHGRRFSRTATVALVRLQKFGEGILPHERTLAAPRADRLELLRATRAEFSFVFALYSDPENKLDKLLEEAKASRPLVNAADRDYHFHRLWPVTDPDTIAAACAAMRDKELLIADGHHRYEMSLAYAEENPDWEAAQYRLMALVNRPNEGLVILPIHRLIKNIANFDAKVFLDSLRSDFSIHTYPGQSPAAMGAVFEAIHEHGVTGEHAFGLFVGDGNYYLIVLNRADAINEVQDHSYAWRRLDVSVLQYLMLEKLLGITAEKISAEEHIEYVHDFPHSIQEATDRVISGTAQALFFMNPTPVEEVEAVAKSRERMPQKSTFFYPKLYSGLVLYSLDES